MAQRIQALEIYTLDLVRGAEPTGLDTALEEAIQFALRPAQGSEASIDPLTRSRPLTKAKYDAERQTLLLPDPSALQETWGSATTTRAPGPCRNPERREVHVSVRLTLFSELKDRPAEAVAAVQDALRAHKTATGFEPNMVVLALPEWVSGTAAGAPQAFEPVWTTLLQHTHSVAIEATNRTQLDVLFPLDANVVRPPASVSLSLPARTYCAVDPQLQTWCSTRGIELVAAPTISVEIPTAVERATAGIGPQLVQDGWWDVSPGGQAVEPVWGLEVRHQSLPCLGLQRVGGVLTTDG